MILLDTTVLAYAVGADHPLRAPCRDLLALARDELVRATTTVEVIQEFAHVRARRSSRAEAVARARDYAQGLAPLVRTEAEELLDGLALFQTSTGLGAFDAVLAAVALRRGWAVASADRGFAVVDGLRHLDPASGSFAGDVRTAG